MSESAKGTKKSKHNRCQKVLQFNLEGKLIKIWRSTKEVI